MKYGHGNFLSYRWILLGVTSLAALAACYTPNQTAFDASVHKQVKAGMPLATAVENLGRLKLTCSGDNPVTCDRIRQRLLPSSCIERVRLAVVRPSNIVETVEIPPIGCAGL
jgi:hypothetical protein